MPIFSFETIKTLLSKGSGKVQIVQKSVAVAANYGDYTLLTVSQSACLVKSVIVKAVTASQADLTSIGIYAGASKVITLVSSVQGAVGNLTDVDEQVSWQGAIELGVGKTIVMTLTGTGATTVDLLLTVEYESIGDNGELV